MDDQFKESIDLANFFRAYAYFLIHINESDAENCWNLARDIYMKLNLKDGLDEANKYLSEDN